MDNEKNPSKWPLLLAVAVLVCGVMLAMWFLGKPGSDQPQILTTTQSEEPVTTTTTTGGTLPEEPMPTVPVTTKPPEQQLILADYGLYSGVFVEDGSDQPVENVAALLVTNGSDQYLDFAKLIYELDGEEATFMVSGLPAGTSAWVLESSRKTANADTDFQHKDTITSFRKDAVNTLAGVDLEFNGTMLRTTNTTDKTLRQLTIYYKVLHPDGNFLGGITYMVALGDLAPGQSAEKIAGHFQPDNTYIVRIGYQE